MNAIKYNLSFNDVLNEIFDTHGWYQGEEFADGVFITVTKNNDVVEVREFNIDKHFGEKYLTDLSITRGVRDMKYRRCYTQPDVERKV